MYMVSVIFADGAYSSSLVDEGGKNEMFRLFVSSQKDKYTIKHRDQEILALDGDDYVMSIQAIPRR